MSTRDPRGDLPGRYWYPLARAGYGDEEIDAVVTVLREFRTTMGAETERFEAAFAERVGAAHAVMVNSGSSADLLVALAMVNPAWRALRPGDEVLVPAVTWPTHIWSLMMAGLTVRLVDVHHTSLGVDVPILEKARTADTKAVSVVHLLGYPAPRAIVDWCDTHNLLLLEDCCEALGSPVGDYGAAAAWSFFFSHQMTTLEGGAVTCDDPGLARLLRLLRSHGWTRDVQVDGIDPRYTFTNWGLNVRPTEVAAAFGLVQLGRLDGMVAERRANYYRFRMALQDLPVHIPHVPKVSPFGLPLIFESTEARDRARDTLESDGVETRAVVAGNVVRHPAARMFGLHGDFPGADRVHDTGLYIGLHPVPEPDATYRVAGLIGKAL